MSPAAVRLPTRHLPGTHPPEFAILVAGWARTERSFRNDPEAATSLVSVGDSKTEFGRDPVELATFTTSASTLLNLDEVITRE